MGQQVVPEKAHPIIGKKDKFVNRPIVLFRVCKIVGDGDAFCAPKNAGPTFQRSVYVPQEIVNNL